MNFRNKKGFKFLPLDIKAIRWAIFSMDNTIVFNDITKSTNSNIIYTKLEINDLVSIFCFYFRNLRGKKFLMKKIKFFLPTKNCYFIRKKSITAVKTNV